MDTVMQSEAPIFRSRSANLNELAAALAKAQGEMQGAKKENKAVITGQTQRTYADLASVWEAVREPLTKNGLAVIQFPRTSGHGVEIETTLLHTSGQYMSDTLWVPCSKDDAQGLGSAITYGRRYALMAVTGIAPVDDDGAAAVAGSAKGMAGGGGDFRPAGPRQFTPKPGETGWVADARRDGLIDDTRKKGTLPAKGKPTAEEARTAKIKAGADKRIKALQDQIWTRAQLDDFWRENKEWIDWMADPVNEALKEYERFTDAFAEAELNVKPVELA